MSGVDPTGDWRPRWARRIVPRVFRPGASGRDVAELRRLTGADAGRCRAWSGAVRARRAAWYWQAWGSALLVSAGWVWLLAFGPPGGRGFFGPALEGLERGAGERWWFGPAEVLVTMVLWFIIPIGASLWLERRLWHARVGRELRRCLATPACLRCGHDCSGVPAAGGLVTCPECGERTPAGNAPGRKPT
jgi:hypothetical protein